MPVVNTTPIGVREGGDLGTSMGDQEVEVVGVSSCGLEGGGEGGGLDPEPLGPHDRDPLMVERSAYGSQRHRTTIPHTSTQRPRVGVLGDGGRVGVVVACRVDGGRRRKVYTGEVTVAVPDPYVPVEELRGVTGDVFDVYGEPSFYSLVT